MQKKSDQRRPRSSPSIDWQTLTQRAREIFGSRRFRPGQKELMEAVLKGYDAIGILPTGLIYVATVKAAEELSQWLLEQGIHVGCYHGKMKAALRQETQRLFMDNEYKVVVATKALGMGIDKPDIRFCDPL